MRCCSIYDCKEKHAARDLCDTHYSQSKRGIPISDMKSFIKRKRLYNKGLICKVKKCERNAERALMCMAHYQRVQKYADPLADKKIIERKGWHYHKTGYVVLSGTEHPNVNSAGTIMEHIKVMSDSLGRPLTKNERVHHKNGVRDDNRIKNLELWSNNHPNGSRVKDLITYAKYIIKKYGKDETKY